AASRTRPIEIEVEIELDFDFDFENPSACRTTDDRDFIPMPPRPMEQGAPSDDPAGRACPPARRRRIMPVCPPLARSAKDPGECAPGIAPLVTEMLWSRRALPPGHSRRASHRGRTIVPPRGALRRAEAGAAARRLPLPGAGGGEGLVGPGAL